MYEDFAEIYDLLMDDVDYPAWAAHYLALAGRGGKLTICECGCGTASMAVEWARAGNRVIGIDQSEEMLAVAARKARGLPITLVKQDMRKLALHRPVDAVFAPCDAVNYLTELRDVRAFFAAAYAQIAPGGVLAFDISTRYKLESVMGNGFFGEDRGEVAYLWQNAWDSDRQVLEMDLTFFVREDGGLYRRFDERHVQRAHEAEELADCLAEVRYEDVRVHGERTFEPPERDAQRVHFVARRA